VARKNQAACGSEKPDSRRNYQIEKEQKHRIPQTHVILSAERVASAAFGYHEKQTANKQKEREASECRALKQEKTGMR